MYILVDCNNFYAACERLFRPDLRDKPIVVLSNNDGCVIARSNEAKAFGIKMGQAYFQIKAICKQHNIQVFSSNYSLYGDLSNRVMSIIRAFWPEIEIYSIDEAFLDIRTLPEMLRENFCKELQQWILQCTGIPVSIGMGKTKTLAKLANYIAKRALQTSVFLLDEGNRFWLDKIAVGEVWGVGRQWGKKLSAQGIATAGDLARMNAGILKKQFTVVLLRTAMELNGIACGGLEEALPKKSILSSKSFGEMQTDLTVLAEAISAHCARACEKARKQGLAAQRLSVFLRSNRHRPDLKQYNNSMECTLIAATADTRVITAIAKRCLQKMFKSGIQYKKVGVMLMDLIDKNHQQYDLFHQHSPETLEKKEKTMAILDSINARFGNHTLKLAAEGYSSVWKMRAEMRSPRYTTCWDELPKVHH